MVGYRMTRERHESLDENEISKSKWDALPLSERLNLARNKVDEKYYYVGGSAYLMFDFSMESIKYYIENGINRIFPDTGHFFSGNNNTTNVLNLNFFQIYCFRYSLKQIRNCECFKMCFQSKWK